MSVVRSPVSGAARVRGAFVGAAAGAVSIAAHGLGGGALTPGQSALGVLIGVCAGLGVLAGARPGPAGLPELMVLLGAGQAIGHAALSVGPGHHHESTATSGMLVAHLVAIVCGAVLIHAAESALGRAASSVRRTLAALRPAPHRDDDARVGVPAAGPSLPRLPLLASAVGTRGPPARA